MDKNTIIGFGLMGLVLVLFTWLGSPTKEQIALQQQQRDSLALVQAAQDSLRLIEQQTEAAASGTDIAGVDSLLSAAALDSLAQVQRVVAYGDLSGATQGEEQLYTLSNDSVEYTFSSKGGGLVATKLPGYKDYLGEPVRLIRPDDHLSFNFITADNRVINTKDLFFTAEQEGNDRLRMTLRSNSGATLSFVYTLKQKYMLSMQIEAKGLDRLVAMNAPYLDGVFNIKVYQNEKSAKSESRYSGLAYKYASDSDVEKLNSNKETISKEAGGDVSWIGYRDMFFSTIVYSPQSFKSVSLTSESGGDFGVLKELRSKFVVPLDQLLDGQPTELIFYSGPNDYLLLKSIDKTLNAGTHFSKILDMGGWFRFINVWIVVPIFNFLERYISNYGVIILLLTLFIKLILSPFTYKSFLSQAKMKVLRPQIEEINKKYAREDQMVARHQATMKLYQQTGVSMMGGCLPMLLQMPILIAMYQYFPTSINLRGESFLWAHDLSTYDDVIHFGFNIPFVGRHISLFCLLMTITQVIYMKITQAAQPQSQSMPGLRAMPYLMAIMLFVFLNQNSAALSYYYFLSMLISILQTQVFKWAIDEEKLLAQLEANKKKPRKKSKFMARLEEMQREQERQLKNKNQQRKS